MRTLFVLGWLLIPLGLAAYHYGPGQDRMRLDEIADRLADAGRQAQAERWDEAVKSYQEALRLLPADRALEIRRIRLDRAKAQMLAKQLPEARQDLEGLVQELAADPKADPALLADARSTLANAQYYMTWLMRLEGFSRDVWEPEIESARQTYRYLAEESRAAGDETAAHRNLEDLESAIRLARMDVGELQGLPLPSQ